MTEGIETKPTERAPTWSKKERRILNLFAVLGLVNILAYILTQSSYVIQNIYYVYGIVTVIDIISLGAGLAVWYDLKERKFHPVMPARYRNFLIATGLWLISIPVVILSYYYPVISINLQEIANYIWWTSIWFSGAYDTLYVMVIAGCWLTKGMGVE